MAGPPLRRFVVSLVAISLIGPLSVHLFLPVLPVVKSVFGISEALAVVRVLRILLAVPQAPHASRRDGSTAAERLEDHHLDRTGRSRGHLTSGTPPAA